MTTYRYILIFCLPSQETWFSSIKTIRSTKSVVANLLHLVNIISCSLHSAQSCQTLANLNFKLKIAGAEAVNNNREIAREYRISKSMVWKWCNQQVILFSGKLKLTAKRASMGHYQPKDPELDQLLADWFSDQRSQGKQVPCYQFA